MFKKGRGASVNWPCAGRLAAIPRAGDRGAAERFIAGKLVNSFLRCMFGRRVSGPQVEHNRQRGDRQPPPSQLLGARSLQASRPPKGPRQHGTLHDVFPTAMSNIRHAAPPVARAQTLPPRFDHLIDSSGRSGARVFRRRQIDARNLHECGGRSPVRPGVVRLRRSSRTRRDGWNKRLEARHELAPAGHAVGTGLNAPDGSDQEIARQARPLTGCRFETAPKQRVLGAGLAGAMVLPSVRPAPASRWR